MERLEGLALWLVENADAPSERLHEGFSRKLVGNGIPLWRAVLSIETLHPEETGGQLVWLAEEAPTATVYYHGVELTSSYLDSPLRVVDETGRSFRCRLDGPPADMSLLRELQQSGATDYLIVPLPVLDRSRSASVSYATRAAGGFCDGDVAMLEVAARLLSPYAERRALRRIAIDLLDTYVGHHTGERIFSGQIHRGAVDVIEAAILMADMRGFTAMSNRQSVTEIVETLNAWLECVSASVDEEGGEILKFIGDGLLAIFRADPDKRLACRCAYQAAGKAIAAVEKRNAERAAGRLEPIRFVVGLHVGAVAYGNIGGRRRLDFTVLGPAVNYSSRLQELAKTLDRRVLMSQAFAEADPGEVVDVGAHPLRGIGDAERVFALPAAA